MVERRKPQIAPGPAHIVGKPNDDFELPAALYYDAITLYEAAVAHEASGDTDGAECYKRSALLAAFCFFEAQINQIAFAHAETHGAALGAVERDVLEEKGTGLDDQGNIVRKDLFYRTESRFTFLAYFLSGKEFDRSGALWQRFCESRQLRDTWTHPKPPFDTWGLTLARVRVAIESVRDVLVKLSEMMSIAPPRWLCPIDDLLDTTRTP